MQNIIVKRAVGEHAERFQGVIEPEDGTWRLVITKNGLPHFLMRTNIEAEDGTVSYGYFDVEDMLPEHFKFEDILHSTFGGIVPPEEEEECRKQWEHMDLSALEAPGVRD